MPCISTCQEGVYAHASYLDNWTKRSRLKPDCPKGVDIFLDSQETKWIHLSMNIKTAPKLRTTIS